MEYVSAAAGIFFLTFALLSLQEEPEEERGRELRRKIPAFLSVFCAFFLAELGDKTQLSAIAFAAREPEQAFAVFLGASIGLSLIHI